MDVAKYCRVTKLPKLSPPKYLFHYVLCQQQCLFSEVPCSQRCLVVLPEALVPFHGLCFPLIFYQRCVQMSYLEFQLLTSWPIHCIPDSDMAYPKDKGKWKTLQPKSSFVQTWSMLRIGSICHLKQLLLLLVFPMEKKNNNIVNQVFFPSRFGVFFDCLFFTLHWNLSTGLFWQELVLQAVKIWKWQ